MDKALRDFARDIDVDVAELNAAETEHLLRKMMACQTRDIGRYVCAAVDPDDVIRMHAETQGRIWQYGQERHVDPTHYAEAFAKATLCKDVQYLPNDTVRAFVAHMHRHAPVLRDRPIGQTLAAFHARNLCNERDVIAAVVGDDDVNAVQNALHAFPLHYDKHDVAALWKDQVRFKDTAAIVTTTDAHHNEEPVENTTPASRGIKFTDDAVLVQNGWNTDDELRLQKNPLVREYAKKTRAPLTFDALSLARQMMHVVNHGDCAPHLHRNQDVATCTAQRDALMHTDNRPALREIADAVLDQVPHEETRAWLEQDADVMAWYRTLPRDFEDRSVRGYARDYLTSGACTSGADILK